MIEINNDNGRVYAPWTQEQADALNRYQEEGWCHPFTCLKMPWEE